MEPAPATRLIAEGDVIDLGDRHFEVLHLPGHSPGSIGLWEEKTGIFFSGDAIYDGQLIDDCYHSNLNDYIRTMRRVRDLPATVVHGGNFPSFGRERLRELAQSFLDAKGDITLTLPSAVALGPSLSRSAKRGENPLPFRERVPSAARTEGG